jgi:hypothetical protein
MVDLDMLYPLVSSRKLAETGEGVKYIIPLVFGVLALGAGLVVLCVGFFMGWSDGHEAGWRECLEYTEGVRNLRDKNGPWS